MQSISLPLFVILISEKKGYFEKKLIIENLICNLIKNKNVYVNRQ